MSLRFYSKISVFVFVRLEACGKEKVLAVRAHFRKTFGTCCPPISTCFHGPMGFAMGRNKIFRVYHPPFARNPPRDKSVIFVLAFPKSSRILIVIAPVCISSITQRALFEGRKTSISQGAYDPASGKKRSSLSPLGRKGISIEPCRSVSVAACGKGYKRGQ